MSPCPGRDALCLLPSDNELRLGDGGAPRWGASASACWRSRRCTYANLLGLHAGEIEATGQHVGKLAASSHSPRAD